MEKNRFRCRTSYYGVLCRRGDEWARGTMELYSKLALIDGHHQLPLRQWSMDKYAVQLQLSTTCNSEHFFLLPNVL